MDWSQQFWPNFLPGFVANLLALIAGIPIGLLLDRVITRLNLREESKAHKQLIANELKENRKILANIVLVLGREENDEIPTPNVLLTRWSTAKQRGFLQIYSDPKTLSVLIDIYRDLEEIDRRIEQLWQVVVNASPSGDAGSRFHLVAGRAHDLAIVVDSHIESFLKAWRVNL